MARTQQLHAISANDLMEGDVVYLRADLGWTRDIDEAVVAESKEASVRLLKDAAQPHRVVGAYLFEVERTPHGLAPIHFRERFRIAGPSVASDFRDR